MTVKIDEQQFLELYDRNVAKIYRYIYFRVDSEETAQDLTSEVFLRSWQHIVSKQLTINDQQSTANNQQQKDTNRQSIISGGQLNNPRAFFYQVARNLITDFYRQKDKAPLSLEEIADKPLADKLADKINDPRETAVLSLEIDFIKDAIKKLNDDYREVIIWRYLDELEIKEIAEILNKREGTVRTLLSRALAALKESLK